MDYISALEICSHMLSAVKHISANRSNGIYISVMHHLD
ncbi:hypothetical protein T4B_4907 [Trichinella pseudospiralis]|uniref:Uncharacterized protein n=1 Tax=Trichinella pseudospiralis TaxID=6337 RepID=A0A0V1GQH3_TRIPS|nr:hypothetical protein T4B_5261 [Trichinella pseudospiralis]KRZ00132.1 hypothetical protein T4B_8730 [Trichinella pseudospiralis]KRZ00195.1 hypothetical protein T4B_5034 [Trichinella pseudospiralis]KRZ00960.1 hypothetical protein T4B_4907 [Trichinella pseudospiralis]